MAARYEVLIPAADSLNKVLVAPSNAESEIICRDKELYGRLICLS
jgi:hypothetical protein